MAERSSSDLWSTHHNPVVFPLDVGGAASCFDFQMVVQSMASISDWELQAMEQYAAEADAEHRAIEAEHRRAAAQEANSRRYNVAGVLRLTDGTYAFFAAGYRLVEAGITVERLIELLNAYEHDRALYQAQVKGFTDAGGEIKRVGRQSNDDLMEDLGL